MKRKIFFLWRLLSLSSIFFLLGVGPIFAERAIDYQAVPPFLTNQEPPLVMLVMGRNHKLYYEAYNDASDLNDDGVIDVGYKPDIDYYGYFDSHKCYEYDTDQERFEPGSVTTTKKCLDGDSDKWSGNFLNYLTMSRMDTMRKVLYGGYRSTDTTETVLERVFIPQDAHSWGKEYTSTAHDGYDIADYSPFLQPITGTRHLFASTTLDEDGDGEGANDPPLLRFLPNSPFRIWDWVAKQNPVCDDSREILPHPQSHEVFSALINYYAEYGTRQGMQNVQAINGSGNPFGGDINYLTVFSGQITIEQPGLYGFLVDGDDAVELLINGEVPEHWVEDPPDSDHWRYETEASWYGEHDACGIDLTCAEQHQGWVRLAAGTHTIEFRHEADSGGSYSLRWWPSENSGWLDIPPELLSLTQTVYSFDPSLLQSTITDYSSRVVVCESGLLEDNCRRYPDGGYKPVGLLQQYGETDKMYFGLLTGSYAKNKSGGVLRKNISSIIDEIDYNPIENTGTGRFTSVNGIINTINKLRTVSFTYTEPDPFSSGEEDPSRQDSHWYTDCGWRTNGIFSDGECAMWGNPIGEMMYEGLRYFAGTGEPSSDYTYSGDTLDAALGLPLADWQNPYQHFARCSKPYMLVLSDINPSFDSDQLPGSAFSDSFNDVFSDFDAGALAGQISDLEMPNPEPEEFFIGQQGSNNDGVCSAKEVANLGNIRGLCPEEPTKEGSYYSAAASYFGLKQDINPVEDEQHVSTMVVGLASPLPKIDIKVGDNIVTLVPTAKTVDGDCGDDLPEGIDMTISDNYQPTDAIADFFVEEITPTYGKFRINFEDLEQGGDFDQDAIVEYEYQVVDDNSLDVTLTSTAASGCLVQNIGYVISGTTADGTYLEVRDFDTSEGADPLPLTATRSFTVDGSQPAATLLKNPLWYAAKWGGFEDSNTVAGEDPVPDDPVEWDKDGDGTPDNYFYVSNPLRLSEQINNSFAEILKRVASGTAAAVVSNSRSGEGAVYQSIFYSQYADDYGNAVSWVGDVRALFVDAYGNIREDSNENGRLDAPSNIVATCDPEQAQRYDKILVFDGTEVKKYIDENCNMVADSNELESGPYPIDGVDIKYLWTASQWLNDTLLVDPWPQRTYNSTLHQRYIFTFVDDDQDMIVDGGEQLSFITGRNDDGGTLPSIADLTDTTKIFPYLTLFPTFNEDPVNPTWVSRISNSEFCDFNELLQRQTNRVISYIRGNDQYAEVFGENCFIPAMRSRLYGNDADGDASPDLTWRLGDIVYSSPVVVGRPSEGYHLLYKDLSYAEFAQKYHKRRNVVYTGGNDGMIHAFNGGFYDTTTHEFRTSIAEPCADENYTPQSTTCTSFTDWDRDGIWDGPNQTPFELGQELWAYVPYNLLPHLYWLTEPDYPHVYYNDLKPKVFDARIFPPDDSDHPKGWGTVMVVGMRLGGGRIQVDMDKTDGDEFKPDIDREMSSAYVIFDITNPEVEPKVLAELSFPKLGYTTCYPAVIPMLSREKVNSDDGGGGGVGVEGDEENSGDGGLGTEENELYTFGTNEWYLVFGSGPADESGHAAGHPTLGSATDILGEAVSKQSAKLYVVDLKELGLHGNLRIVKDVDGTATSTAYDSSDAYIQALDPNAFISDPVTVDYDKDFNTDAVYFGTVSGSSGSWGGGLRRLVIDRDPRTNIETNPANWITDSILVNAGQPVTTAPTIALDNKKAGDDNFKWIYFGTGRFFTREDAEDTSQQSYFGIKEPVVRLDVPGTPGDGTLTWAQVQLVELLNVSDAQVSDNRSVALSGLSDCTNNVQDWNCLISNMDTSYSGWKYNFFTGTNLPSERNLGQAALLGELLTFTTYTPSEDICAMEGESSLYALYYKTGTSYYKSTIRRIEDDASPGTPPDPDNPLPVEHKISLGQGLTITPTLHTGRESGTKAFVQTSEGGIKTVEQENPGATKSGKHTWRVRK